MCKILIFFFLVFIGYTSSAQISLQQYHIAVGNYSDHLSGSSTFQYGNGALTMGSLTDNYLTFQNGAGNGHMQYDAYGNFVWWTPGSSGIKKMILTNDGRIKLGGVFSAGTTDYGSTFKLQVDGGAYIKDRLVIDRNDGLTSLMLWRNDHNGGIQFEGTKIRWVNNVYNSALDLTGNHYSSTAINVAAGQSYFSGGAIKVNLNGQHQSYLGGGLEVSAAWSSTAVQNAGAKGVSTTLTGWAGNYYGSYSDITIATGGTGKAWAFYAANGMNYFKDDVLIGSTTDVGDYKLQVAGTILAKKLKIEIQSVWPDYVFKKSYRLRSIEEVEKFIIQNGHLPEVPSAKEMNEKGLDVEESQVILLKKIEELTLYIIDLQKQINELKTKK